jgi:hypothetical protein
MKKLLVSFIILTIVLSSGLAFGQRRTPPPGKEIIPASSCAWLTVYGLLCHDTDDGKIYKWNGATQVELAAGASGDMTKAVYDAADDGKIDITAGGTGLDLTGLTGTLYVTAGVAAVTSAADMKTALGLVIGTNVQAYDADLTTYAGITPTANAQTVLGETFAQMQASLSIDDLITLSGVVEGSVHLSTFTGATIADNVTIKAALQAIETALELRAPIASPTFTGVATFPNDGLHILDTNATHDLIITPGSDLSADRIFTITTGDAARTLTMTGDATLNQDVSSTANAAFSTLNVTGANALNVGTSRTNDGSVKFKSGTALNDFIFTIQGGNFTADETWKLPLSVPGGSNYLLNVDADGQMDYAAPLFTSFTGGNWKVFYTNGTGVIGEVALGAAGTVLMSNGVAAAPTMQTPSGAGDVTGVGNCSGGDCLDGSSDGGTYIRLYDGDSNYTQISASNTASDVIITLPATTSTLPGLGLENIFTGNNTFGDADSDTITIRAMVIGGNSRALQIAASLASPTFATTPDDLYVGGVIETPGIIYAASFESVLTAGNTGAMRVKEDPTNGTNFRGFVAPSTLTQDLDFKFPDGNNTANQFFLLGAPAANVSTMTYGTFSTGDFDVTANIVTIKALGIDIGQINASGTPGAGNFLRGDGSWQTVTAAAAGVEGSVQYNTSGALDGEAAFSYNAGTNVLTAGAYIGNVDGVYVTSQATGDIFAAASASTITRIAAVAAGQPVLSGGAATAPAYAGYTFSGTAAQTYTFPSVTSTLVPAADPVFTSSLQLPNAAGPTVNAAGEIAIRSGAGAASGITFYGNAAPGAVLIPAYIAGPTLTVVSPLSTSDYFYMYAPYALTIRTVHYLCQGGTNWIGQIQICDGNGSSCTDTQAADTTAVAGTTSNETTFTDATVPAGVWVLLKTTSVAGVPTVMNVQMDFTVD